MPLISYCKLIWNVFNIEIFFFVWTFPSTCLFWIGKLGTISRHLHPINDCLHKTILSAFSAKGICICIRRIAIPAFFSLWKYHNNFIFPTKWCPILYHFFRRSGTSMKNELKVALVVFIYTKFRIIIKSPFSEVQIVSINSFMRILKYILNFSDKEFLVPFT